MKYFVMITETLSRGVTIEAKNEESAQKMVEDMYYNGDIILDDSDFVGVEFETSVSL